MDVDLTEDKMNVRLFQTRQAQHLKKVLDVYSKQHDAIARNVANANNPNFQRVQTDFSKVLQESSESLVKTRRAGHIQTSHFNTGSDFQGRGDKGGKVDLTKEMAELAINQIKHDFVSRALQRLYNGLSTAIVGRNR